MDAWAYCVSRIGIIPSEDKDNRYLTPSEAPCERIRGGFRKIQNLAQKGLPQAWPTCKALGIDRRNTPSIAEGQRRLQHLLAQYQRTLPEACKCLEEDVAPSLNHRQVPARHQQYVRPSNLAKRAFAEERRRTKGMPPLWDAGRLLQRSFAVLMRVSEHWGKKQCSEFEQHHMQVLRQS